MIYLIDSDWVIDYLDKTQRAVIHHNLTLVTRNVSHFRRIPGLSLY